MVRSSVKLSKSRAIAIIDLGFGDAGKGLATDYLARKVDAAAVVRFNGGAQAGHNVITPEGVHHCFSQFGAATLHGDSTTWLGPDVVVHPGGLLNEANRLAGLGVRGALSRVFINERCPVITPFHQAVGRLRELNRGSCRHGSCGIGFGEVVADVRSGNPSLFIADLLDRERARRIALGIYECKRAELFALKNLDRKDEAVRQELEYFSDPASLERWLAQAVAIARSLQVIGDEEWHRRLSHQRHILFEGAQGMLLDEDYGFVPHTTYSHCGFDGVAAIAGHCGFLGEVSLLGVTRAFTVRHGDGPLPSESPALRDSIREPHNVTGPWQGAVRYGLLDLLMLRYARACLAERRALDGLFVTHLDSVRRDFQWVHAYEGNSSVTPTSSAPQITTELPIHAPDDDQARALLSGWLRQVAVLTECPLQSSADPGRELVQRLGYELGATELFGSVGPRSGDVDCVSDGACDAWRNSSNGRDFPVVQV